MHVCLFEFDWSFVHLNVYMSWLLDIYFLSAVLEKLMLEKWPVHDMATCYFGSVNWLWSGCLAGSS